MELKTAIEILKYHNLWRRGLVEDPIYTPKQIGIAIDTIIKYYELQLLTEINFN